MKEKKILENVKYIFGNLFEIITSVINAFNDLLECSKQFFRS